MAKLVKVANQDEALSLIIEHNVVAVVIDEPKRKEPQQKPQQGKNRVFNTDEVANRWRKSKAQILHMIREGKLPAYKDHPESSISHWRICEQDILELDPYFLKNGQKKISKKRS